MLSAVIFLSVVLHCECIHYSWSHIGNKNEYAYLPKMVNEFKATNNDTITQWVYNGNTSKD